MKRVLIACEYSGTVREAFRKRGFDAWSCDLLPTEIPGQHIQGDVLPVLGDGWDLIIAHPPCTHLAVSGARHFEAKRADGRQAEAIEFFMAMINAPAFHIAVENPVCIMSSVYRPADQVINPFYFGDEARKKTCLWLKNLPKLCHIRHDDLFEKKTWVSEGELIHYDSGRTMPKWYADAFRLPKEQRQKIRSKTFQGIADAMATQCGDAILNGYSTPKQTCLQL